MSFNIRNPRDWLTVMPDFARLVWRVSRDNRVSPFVRAAFVGVAAYLVFPVDVVPDWIPFAGQVDDLIVVTLGTRVVLQRVEPHILLEHWSGDPEVLEQLVGRRLAGGA